MKVIYHGGCFDGFTAAWLARGWLRNNGIHNAEFIGAAYQTDPPDVSGEDVMILDFSYKRAAMERIIEDAKFVTVFDHHETAQQELEGLDGPKTRIVFDMERSGAGITFDQLYPDLKRIVLVDIVEDRDLWRFSLPFTRAVQAYMATVPMTFDEWDVLNTKIVEDLPGVIASGQGIIDYIENFGKKAREHFHFMLIGGMKTPVINVPYMNSSDHANALLDWYLEQMPDANPIAGYFFLNKHKQWQFGLRSKGDLNVAEVAKQYGGGGHAHAAGFSVDLDKLPPILA